MLWGQDIKVFTDHKNLKGDALGLTSDRVYQWWLLSEEYALKIIYIKEIYNTVADVILQLDYNPKLNTTNNYTRAMLGVESEELSVCSKPFGPKPEIQHGWRERGVPTLTWEEVTIREGRRRCCSCTKKEIMSLRLKVKVIFSLQARSMYIV